MMMHSPLLSSFLMPPKCDWMWKFLMPVSSRASRTTAVSMFSPRSTVPAGSWMPAFGCWKARISRLPLFSRVMNAVTLWTVSDIYSPNF